MIEDRFFSYDERAGLAVDNVSGHYLLFFSVTNGVVDYT